MHGAVWNWIRAEITRQNQFGGEKQFKSQSENPPKPPWRGKTSAGNARFPAKSILAGNSAVNSILRPVNNTTQPQPGLSHRDSPIILITREAGA